MTPKIKLLLVVIFLAALVAGYYFFLSKPDRAGNTVADNTFGWKYPTAMFPKVGPNPDAIAYSNIRDPGGLPLGLPVRLKIPIIGVDSAIEDALITSDGRMDVPSGSVNVAWFALGPHPGQVGSAVIGGHFGIRAGVKFVFYDLDKLRAGDKIFVVDDKGDTLAFIVRRTQTFDRNADATTVFTSNDGLAHLNLITCEGVWNQVEDSYPQRLVVFTDSIPYEKPPATAVEPPIVTPQPATPATPTDPATPTSTVPTPVVVPPAPPTFPETFIQSVKSSYATPRDALITSLLLVLIVFTFYEITKRKFQK